MRTVEAAASASAEVDHDVDLALELDLSVNFAILALFILHKMLLLHLSCSSLRCDLKLAAMISISPTFIYDEAQPCGSSSSRPVRILDALYVENALNGCNIHRNCAFFHAMIGCLAPRKRRFTRCV